MYEETILPQDTSRAWWETAGKILGAAVSGQADLIDPRVVCLHEQDIGVSLPPPVMPLVSQSGWRHARNFPQRPPLKGRIAVKPLVPMFTALPGSGSLLDTGELEALDTIKAGCRESTMALQSESCGERACVLDLDHSDGLQSTVLLPSALSNAESGLPLMFLGSQFSHVDLPVVMSSWDVDCQSGMMKITDKVAYCPSRSVHADSANGAKCHLSNSLINAVSRLALHQLDHTLSAPCRETNLKTDPGSREKSTRLSRLHPLTTPM